MKKCMMLFVMVMSFFAMISAGSPQVSAQCPRVANCPRVADCPHVCPVDSTVRCPRVANCPRVADCPRVCPVDSTVRCPRVANCPRVADCPQVCLREGKRCPKSCAPCRPYHRRGCRR